MAKTTHATLLVLAAAYCFGALACSSSNEPATPSSSAGAPGIAGAPASAAGAPTTPGTAGAPATGTAGAPATGTAGAPATGTAGAAATGGTSAGGAPGTAGATSTAGAAGATTGTAGSSGVGQPSCSGMTTAAGAEPTKGGACTASDPQLCYKTCGPQSTGYKSETCTAGAYAESSGCNFDPNKDFACYKVPTTVDATCPTTTIVASSACTMAACITCTDATKHYFDSQMNQKVGYCTCPPPNASGTSKWSCASDTAWPCPTGKGC